MNIELRPLSVDDGADIYEMLQDIPNGENGFVNRMNGESYEVFREWLVRQVRSSQSIDLIDGWLVPQNTYWLYADGRPVGIGRIRHYLTDALRQAGGNIGYAVRKSERGKGYGNKLLSLLLAECRKRNMDRVLITVRNHNAASIRVALKNGGVIDHKNDIRHFIWIDLKEDTK